MPIKRIRCEARFSFFDVQGETRIWSGIPLSRRVDYLAKLKVAKDAILHDEQWLKHSLEALEIAGFERSWVHSISGSMTGPLLVGDVDLEGKVPALIEAAEFPYVDTVTTPGPPRDHPGESEPLELERLDKIWLTLMNGDRLIINPLNGNQRRELDNLLGVLEDFQLAKSIGELYDTSDDFRFTCDSILGLYGIPVDQIGLTELVQLIFNPGYLHCLELPLMQKVGGTPLPQDENGYDAVIASLYLAQPKISLMEHLRVLEEVPWVQVQSIMNSANAMTAKMEEEAENNVTGRRNLKRLNKDSPSPKQTKSKPSQWKKSDFETTLSKLQKLQSGEANISKMSKLQQRALGG